jgi:hypothetical protein
MQRKENYPVVPFYHYNGVSPYDLGPALTWVQAHVYSAGKIKWLFRCLYPIYAIQIEMPTGETRIYFYDAYLPNAHSYNIPTPETLRTINETVDKFSVTANRSKVVKLWEDLKTITRVDEGQGIKGVLNHDFTFSLLPFTGQYSSENILWTVHLEPSVKQEDILCNVNRLIGLDEEIQIFENICSMFNSVAVEVLSVFQRQLDENFEDLEKWKTQRIDELSENRLSHENKMSGHAENLETRQNLQRQNQRVLDDINSNINRLRVMRVNADASNRYQIDLQVSDLERQRDNVTSQQHHLEKQISSDRSQMHSEQEEINKIDVEIARARDMLPDDLILHGQDLDTLKKLKDDIQHNLEQIQSAQQDLRSSLLSLQNTLQLCDEGEQFSTLGMKVSIRLFYLSLFFVQKRRFGGLQRRYLFTIPCSLPLSIDALSKHSMNSYFQKILLLMPKVDYKQLKKMGRIQNYLKKPKELITINKGLTFLYQEALVAGFDKIHLRKPPQ